MVTRLAMAVTLLSYVIIAAPPVRANATDDAFLGALTRKDIHFESPQTALIAAHEVCTELDAGKSKSDIASTIMQNTNLDGYHAGYSWASASARTARTTPPTEERFQRAVRDDSR
ncbi:hypothetical protein MKUB_27630 [Mycobacterium kubicae]|uniref:DUF732 domain-containing protein n=1 Tax=Mycobacterium kubicae TaxID=120959 RepID=A0ABQ1BNJ7_9MYCO|nr:DUF732 domain-containing protein [Mycobacterium kubicae]MCV7096127.1 DUF732 domain-containing protein [Mycobacterium kubicae]ORV99202.1 hypothetical protein AWC13_10600 [Mycobacterium kubicae]GFG65273.1 hypothetical protein MKUB_27630 [Mycobacterium kubicae]